MWHVTKISDKVQSLRFSLGILACKLVLDRCAGAYNCTTEMLFLCLFFLCIYLNIRLIGQHFTSLLYVFESVLCISANNGVKRSKRGWMQPNLTELNDKRDNMSPKCWWVKSWTHGNCWVNFSFVIFFSRHPEGSEGRIVWSPTWLRSHYWMVLFSVDKLPSDSNLAD